METKTLAEVVRRAQKGDSKAQQELYIDSSKSVYFLALKILKNQSDAEDITQDVFITVFEKVSELKQPAAYYKWLNQITANKCMSFLRKKKPVLTDEQDILDILELDEDEETPEKLYDDEETRRIILEIIDELPDAQRLCIMYRYFNQLSIEEIAEITATNEHTVRSRLMLARNKIRAAILEKEEKEGIRLHVLIPITPILMRALEDFQMPQGVSEQMWQKIAEGAGIAAAGGGAAAAASEAAKAGTKEAAKQGVKAKVIGGVAGVAAVAVIATVILWPKPEEPAQVTASPSSTPVVSQTEPPSEPEPISDIVEFQTPCLDEVVRKALGLGAEDEITQNMLTVFSMVSVSQKYAQTDAYELWLYTYTGENTTIDISEFDMLYLSDILYFINLQSLCLENPPAINDYSALAQLRPPFQSLEIIGAEDLTELPEIKDLNTIITLRLENLPNLTSFPSFDGVTQINNLVVDNCGITDFTAMASLSDMKAIKMTNTPLSDVSVFSNMDDLAVLDLKDCQIQDPSPLAQLPNIKSINLAGNPIQDYSSLDVLSDDVKIIIQ